MLFSIERLIGCLEVSGRGVSLVCKALSQKVITSLKSCLFTGVLDRGALVNLYCICCYLMR